jgi:hypothetical protein
MTSICLKKCQFFKGFDAFGDNLPPNSTDPEEESHLGRLRGNCGPSLTARPMTPLRREQTFLRPALMPQRSTEAVDKRIIRRGRRAAFSGDDSRDAR